MKSGVDNLFALVLERRKGVFFYFNVIYDQNVVVVVWFVLFAMGYCWDQHYIFVPRCCCGCVCGFLSFSFLFSFLLLVFVVVFADFCFIFIFSHTSSVSLVSSLFLS